MLWAYCAEKITTINHVTLPDLRSHYIFQMSAFQITTAHVPLEMNFRTIRPCLINLMKWIVVLWQLFIAVTMVTMLKGQINKIKKLSLLSFVCLKKFKTRCKLYIRLTQPKLCHSIRAILPQVPLYRNLSIKADYSWNRGNQINR